MQASKLVFIDIIQLTNEIFIYSALDRIILQELNVEFVCHFTKCIIIFCADSQSVWFQYKTLLSHFKYYLTYNYQTDTNYVQWCLVGLFAEGRYKH